MTNTTVKKADLIRIFKSYLSTYNDFKDIPFGGGIAKNMIAGQAYMLHNAGINLDSILEFKAIKEELNLDLK